MGKGHSKVWAILLMTAMVLSTTVGISGLGEESINIKTEMSVISPDSIGPYTKRPVNENLLDGKSRLRNDPGVKPLEPPPGNEIMGTSTYDFDSDTAGQLPADPPWSYVDQPVGQALNFGPDDFEDDILGEKPDSPPWTATDGLSPKYYWAEDFEGFTPGEDLTSGQISGDLGYFGSFDPAATLTAEAPPAGSPALSILSMVPGLDTGSLCADFIDGGAGSYWGPAGIGGPTTDQGYCGGWVYMTAVARFDLGIVDMGLMAVTAEVAFQNDNNIYHWPGGVYTQIPGITWALDTWHELFIQYDDPTDTYSVWFDGVQYVPGSAFTAASADTDGMVWFGSGLNDLFVDNFCHMWPPTGLTDRCIVDNTQAHSGAQSVFLDQNGEAAPEQVRMVADFSPVMAGAGTWDYWLRTTSMSNTDGALAEFMDVNENSVIQVRGTFSKKDPESTPLRIMITLLKSRHGIKNHTALGSIIPHDTQHG